MNKQISLFDNNSDFYETDISTFNEKSAAFRVHASLIYKLGESLIADEVTALSELIKNSYDADATFCSLDIDSNYTEEVGGKERKGIITLIDNGCGMDLQTIVNGWLTLSNSPKKKMKKEKRMTPKYNRYPLGDKGLGRLSVQKLGRFMQMITKTATSNIEYTVTIPWGDFLKNTTIDQIRVTIDQKETNDNKSYTKIVIKDLVNTELWEDSDQINVLSNSINKIVSPFKSKDNNFKVIAKVNNQTIEEIGTIFEDLLSRARAKHIIFYSNGRSVLRSYFTASFFYNREMMDRIMQDRFSVNCSSLTDFWNTCKNDLENFEFVPNDKNVFTSEDLCIFEDIQLSNDKVKHSDPGDFQCEIYEYTLDKQFLDKFYQTISYSELIDQTEYKEFIERFHGIKVVRDGFIVQGYGEGDGGDWLGLSSSSKTKGSFFDLRNDSVIGCVHLTGVNNSVLKETTNREGFVEDEYYLAFKRILDDSIRRINKNRKKINDEMRSYLNQAINTTADGSFSDFSIEPAISKVKNKLGSTFDTSKKSIELINDTLSECSVINEELSGIPLIPSETSETIARIHSNISRIAEEYNSLLNTQKYINEQVDTLSFEFEGIKEKLQVLFELAGLGISVEMFTHEFDSSIRNIRLKSNTIVNSNPSTEALIRHINYINISLDTLRKQMSYFNPGLKFVRSEKQTFSFVEFIKEHKEFYSERCKANGINYIIDIREDFEITVNRGMINQVFDNLFNNSEYWLKFSEEKSLIKEKTFTVKSVEKGFVLVFDNGIGVSRDIETRLFEAFESKKDHGRGLGLYIVANNLKYHSSRIRLLGERNEHGNLYKFEIDFSSALS